MNIGLDFDGCITEDPLGWAIFCNTMRGRGHNVYIVTMRYDSETDDTLKALSGNVDGIIFTGRKAKKPYVEEHHLLVIDVWIDDNPLAVHYNADKVFGRATPEGIVVYKDSADKVVVETPGE